MNNQHPQITLGEVLEMQPGDKQNKHWIDGEFDAFVSNITPRTYGNGQTMWTALLTDPDNSNIRLETTFFKNPIKYQNCVCHFSGGGMSREDYNGTAKVGLGQKTVIQPIGRPEQPPAQQQRQGSQRNNQNTRTDRPPQQQQGPAKIPLQGNMVGACMAQAIGILKHEYELDKLSENIANEWKTYVFSPEFGWDVHTIASDLIRINRYLEAGQHNLAPSAATRAKDPLQDDARQPDSNEQGYQPDPDDAPQEEEPAPPPQQRTPPKKNPPGPAGSAFPVDNNLDEDVPF